MTEYKEIKEKTVWLLMKKYSGGLIEIVGVYWIKETAERVVLSNLPKSSDIFAITMTETKLFGYMLDIK